MKAKYGTKAKPIEVFGTFSRTYTIYSDYDYKPKNYAVWDDCTIDGVVVGECICVISRFVRALRAKKGERFRFEVMQTMGNQFIFPVYAEDLGSGKVYTYNHSTRTIHLS